MKANKGIAALLAVILTLGALVSCGGKKDGAAETYTPETVEPIDDNLQTDYTDDGDKLAYINALRATFADMAETDGTLFTVSESPTGVTVIGYTGSAAEVRIPTEIGGRSVTGIADGAFADNGLITKLYLPDGIVSVGEGVLEGMTALRALRTPLMGADADEAQFLGYLFGGTQYADNGMRVPATLEYLELGGNMETLADFALFECDDLICVTLPDAMKAVGIYSFYYCTRLLAVNTDKLTTVGEHAFDSCRALTRMDFGGALTSIGIGAMEGCIGLRTLTLPFVGGSATENTYLGYLFGAAALDFSGGFYPPYLTRVTLLEGCSAFGDYAFYECDSLERVNIPEGVTALGIRAFSGCVRLETVTLPNSLTAIGDNAFFGCLSLGGVEIDADASCLASIGVNAFYDCGLLRQIKLSRGLTALPASCFAGCVSLESIDLGGVTSVGKNAFYKCTRLQSVSAQSDVTFAAGNEVAENLLNGENR